MKLRSAALLLILGTSVPASDPTSAKHWLELASSHSQLKEWDAAIAAYRHALELDPAATTYNNLANIYFRRGDYDSAAELYGQALAVEPSYLLARFHHGWCLRQLNRPAEAEAAFGSCLGITPANDRERQMQLDCLFGLGSLRHRAGDYESSARAMEQVLAVHPSHPEARYYLGMAYRQLGRLEDARVQLEIHARFMRSRQPASAIEKPTLE